MTEYIEREALKQQIVDEQTKNHVGIGNAGYEIGYHNGLSMAMAMVLTAPAADVAPVVHGRWDVSDTELGWCCKCSVCSSNAVMQYRFCPYCGADMRGE